MRFISYKKSVTKLNPTRDPNCSNILQGLVKHEELFSTQILLNIKLTYNETY